MAGEMHKVETSTWEDVFETMESFFLIDLKIQSTDPNLTYHEAALLMNRLETAVSILRSLTDLFSMGSSAASIKYRCRVCSQSIDCTRVA